MFTLRPYQGAATTAVSQHFKQGSKRILMCSPTGSGKTVAFSDMAVKAVQNGFRVGVCVDRKELLNQAQEKLNAYGLRPSLITAGKYGRKGHACIATIQTLMRRELPDVNFWIIDECHKQIFDKLLQEEKYKDAYFLGVTATPKRSGKMTQLRELYDEMVETVSISELISDGYLVPAITFGKAIPADMLDQIGMRNGDYNPDQLFEKFNKNVLYKGVVENYQKFANGTKALCFCINVAHSKITTAAFRAAGINAVHLDGSMKKGDRNSILKAFKDGLIDVLVNCEILTTGYDEWTIETVIVNRATASLSLWLQMCGRGGRPTDPQFKDVPGYLQKTSFTIIDHGGNVRKHGFWEQDREWSLSHRRNALAGVAPVKTCPEEEQMKMGIVMNAGGGCGALVHASIMLCPWCGYKWERKEREEVSAEFGKIDNVIHLPAYLQKPYSEMGIHELEEVRVLNRFDLHWMTKQILWHPVITLEQYQDMKNYSPKWAYSMRKQYKVKSA